MSKNDKILIASAKGGVGKSTTALGLALSYSAMGKSVLLIDCDISSRSLDILCGDNCPVLYNLGDVLLDRVPAADAVFQPFEEHPNISLCTAPHLFQDEEAFFKTGHHLDELTGTAVRKVVEALPHDITLIDTSSGGGTVCASGLIGIVSTVIITSEQSRTSVRAAEYTASQMEKIGISNQRLVVCSFDATSAMRGERAGVIEMIDKSTLKCVGVVPYDKRLAVRQDNGLIPDKKCISQKAYYNIAQRLSGVNVPLFSGMKSYERKRSRLI